MSCSFSSKTVTVKDFDRICRTCLGEDKLSPILGTLVGDLKVVDLLDYSVTMEIKNDALPANICENCLNEFYRIYEFKKQCQDNEAMLKLLLENSPSENFEKHENAAEYSCNITLVKPEDVEYKCDLSDSDNKETIKEESDEIKKLECRDCGHIVSNKEELRAHRKTAKHVKVRNHKCNFCGKAFTRSKLQQHMRSHTKEKPYQCDICLQRFSMSGNLKRHKMTHTGERPHVCSMCGKGFIQATSLHAHEKLHNTYEELCGKHTMKFSCQYCGRGFKRVAPYHNHLAKHISGTNDVKPVTKIDQSEKSDSPREHICDICARAYRTKHLLKAHRLTHGEKSFLCSDCGKGFVTKAALQSHLKVHTGEKPHTCTICKKSFAHVGSFESHMLIHLGLKPYSCSFCPKKFTQLSHLTYHLRTHSGERPYTCSYCNKSFALKGNLTVHVRTHTGETPYVCPVCNKGFYDSSSMKKHWKNHKEVWMEGQQPQHVGYQVQVMS